MKEAKTKQIPKSRASLTGQFIVQKKEARQPFFNARDSANGSSFFSPSLSNNQLPESLQSKAQTAFGNNFSNVMVHKNSSRAHTMNALAFAQGNNIHFAPGMYNPNSKSGQELIGHELTHVQQQRNNRVQANIQTKNGLVNNSPTLEAEADVMGKRFANTSVSSTVQKKTNSQSKTSSNAPMQMLLRDNFPWTGVVIDTVLLSIRDKPNGVTIADLPKRTLVSVKRNRGHWLELEVDTTQHGVVLNRGGRQRVIGDNLKGYTFHRYVDDAGTYEMTALLGSQATWTRSAPNVTAATGGAGTSTTFDVWASAATESAAPSVLAVTTINCWEMILLAAYRIGALSWNWIHDLYTNPQPTTRAELGAWTRKLPGRITRGGLTTHDTKTRTPLPSRGDLVFFDGAGHVALATGNGDEILTFWPPPNTAFTSGGTVDAVKLSTIHELANFMISDPRMPGTINVTFGAPAW